MNKYSENDAQHKGIANRGPNILTFDTFYVLYSANSSFEYDISISEPFFFSFYRNFQLWDLVPKG